MNAFEILGIKSRLVIDEETLRAAFREAGKSAHPDAGGGDDDFARLRAAFEIVASPSKRLRHWLELQGIAADVRGSVDSAVMDRFSQVAEATQQAEAVIRRREEAKSALGMALLERETQICRESVETALRGVDAAIQQECAVFPLYEDGSISDSEAASRTTRNLAFLEKWRAGLRGVFARLV